MGIETVQDAKESLESKFNQFLSFKIESISLALHEMSKLLNTGLSKETLAILVSLIESGVHPDALAAAVQELREEKEIA